MRFPTIWYVRPAKAQTSLRIRADWSEPLLVAWIFYDCWATDWTLFEVSKLNRRLYKLVWVYTCQNVKLLEISCHGSIIAVTCNLAAIVTSNTEPYFQPKWVCCLLQSILFYRLSFSMNLDWFLLVNWKSNLNIPYSYLIMIDVNWSKGFYNLSKWIKNPRGKHLNKLKYAYGFPLRSYQRNILQQTFY